MFTNFSVTLVARTPKKLTIEKKGGSGNNSRF